MNFGFFGLQYSFGLQQANMSPIYKFLGAAEDKLPYLWLAGPLTGLIIQPIVGAMSDKTVSRWGRRTPYFFIGAIFCSICLFFMPFSKTVWMAASILWILDAGNNITQEPYRAFVTDRLNPSQHSIGFLSQSAFTGLGQTLSYLTPTILIGLGFSALSTSDKPIPTTTFIAFIIGAFFSIGSIMWSLYTTKEYPLTPKELEKIHSAPKGFLAPFKEISSAFKQMPKTMVSMIPMMLFSWYAMFTYWIYISSSISKTFFDTSDGNSIGYSTASIWAGQIGAFYNCITFISAFAIAKMAIKYNPKLIHGFCLSMAGIGLVLLPGIHEKNMLFIPMIGMGVSWASMMGTPYIMLAGSVPPERTGVYMGIFNMFIVIPMFIQNLTVPLYYKTLLGNNPENAIRLAGILLILAAIAAQFIKYNKTEVVNLDPKIIGVGH
ncbi:MAG: MFS transporter [Ferruginibacter sp.]